MSQLNRLTSSRKKEIAFFCCFSANSKSSDTSKQVVAETYHHETASSEHADLDFATMSTADIMHLILEKKERSIEWK